MKKITAQEFYDMIEENPSVFKHWETPLEITEFVKCNKSPITYLSKYLIFSGKDSEGATGNFRHCQNLKIATGSFQGYVTFSTSGIKRIADLTILKPDKPRRWAANFAFCKSLQIATGSYPGFVNFFESGIHSIQNLHIQNPDEDGDYANFHNCPNLHTLQGWDLSKKIDIEPKKLAIEKENRALKKFVEENRPQMLPFL
jgi:hypothetical protein